MKRVVVFLVLFLAVVCCAFCFADAATAPPATAPTPAATPAPETLSEVEGARLQALQARRSALNAQAQTVEVLKVMLERDIAQYEAAVRAAHPKLKLKFDPQQVVWGLDEPPAQQQAPTVPVKKEEPKTK